MVRSLLSPQACPVFAPLWQKLDLLLHVTYHWDNLDGQKRSYRLLVCSQASPHPYHPQDLGLFHAILHHPANTTHLHWIFTVSMRSVQPSKKAVPKHTQPVAVEPRSRGFSPEIPTGICLFPSHNKPTALVAYILNNKESGSGCFSMGTGSEAYL